MPEFPTYTQQDLPEPLLQSFASGTVLDDGGNVLPLDSNVSLGEAVELYSMVRSLRATSTAEVGFAKGISATAICQALKDGRGGQHHIMDPFQAKYGNAGLAMLRRAGLEGCMAFHEALAEDVFPSLPSLDFVFIDASHLFDLTMLEFVLADKKLRVGGVIAFHDLWMPSLRKLLRFILSNRSYELVTATGEQSAMGGPSQKFGAKDGVFSMLNRLPIARKLLRKEVLHPWRSFRVSNLSFVRKIENDQREWTHFQEF